MVDVHAATETGSSLVSAKSDSQPGVEPVVAPEAKTPAPTTPATPNPESDASLATNEKLVTTPEQQDAASEEAIHTTAPVAASAQIQAATPTTTGSDKAYPVLSQDKSVDIGVDTSEVKLTADQIAGHFTATVENRDDSDKDNNPAKNKSNQSIGDDGSIQLTSNGYHNNYSAGGTATSMQGHQAAHVSFEHEIDFGHNFSLIGALGIGSKTTGGADSVGIVFAPGEPAKATEGGSGGDLGIGGLDNAFGFVFDEYNNQDKHDPSSSPYFGWRTTNASGALQAVANSSEWKSASQVSLNDRTVNTLNKFTMDYNADKKQLTMVLGNQTFVRTISDTSQGYSISVAASTGGNWNDYSAKIDSFTYTPKTMPLAVNLVDSADSDALLNNANVTAVANIGDTVSVFSTQAAAQRAVAAGLVNPNLVSVLPTDSAGNVYVIDGEQTPSSNGIARSIGNKAIADDTYYTYTVKDGDDQTMTVPVRLAFTAKVTPVDSKTKAANCGATAGYGGRSCW